jgi:hypothetical protein
VVCVDEPDPDLLSVDLIVEVLTVVATLVLGETWLAEISVIVPPFLSVVVWLAMLILSGCVTVELDVTCVVESDPDPPDWPAFEDLIVEVDTLFDTLVVGETWEVETRVNVFPSVLVVLSEVLTLPACVTVELDVTCVVDSAELPFVFAGPPLPLEFFGSPPDLVLLGSEPPLVFKAVPLLVVWSTPPSAFLLSGLSKLLVLFELCASLVVEVLLPPVVAVELPPRLVFFGLELLFVFGAPVPPLVLFFGSPEPLVLFRSCAPPPVFSAGSPLPPAPVPFGSPLCTLTFPSVPVTVFTSHRLEVTPTTITGELVYPVWPQGIVVVVRLGMGTGTDEDPFAA